MNDREMRRCVECGGVIAFARESWKCEECDGVAHAARRERIAMACLAGMLAGDAGPSHYHRQTPMYSEPAGAAACAVGLADALIAALDAKGGAT